MGVGVETAAGIAGFTLLGWWLDSLWSTRPWLMLAGLVLGFLGGMYRLWRIGQRNFKN